MTEYVALEVRLFHEPGTPEEIRDRVDSLLRAQLTLDYDHDLEVDLIESAG